MATAEEAITALVERINRAWTENRLADLEACFHAGMVIAAPDGTPLGRGRDSCIASYAEFLSRAHILDWRMDLPKVTVCGATAVAVYAYRMRWTVGDKRFDEPGRDLLVFTLYEGRWQAVWRTVLSETT